ncbi:MAG: hypothetical protein Q8933_22120 [Bacteroidota bacterium]|nr:hypothetical protein [Bacteroidota bacterium]
MNFNKIVILKSEKLKYFKSFLSSLTCTAFGIGMVLYKDSTIGWIIAAFFGFAAIASFIPMLPNQSYLKLDKYGLTIRGMLQTVKIAWHEVENFASTKRSHKEIVTYSYVNKTKKNRNYINVENLIGKVEVLPDVCGMQAGELAELLERFRIRSGSIGLNADYLMN